MVPHTMPGQHSQSDFTIIGGGCHQYNFSHNKHVFVVTKTRLFVASKTFAVVTNICRKKHVFVMTKLLSRQAYFCRNKIHILSWWTCVCCDNSKLVVHNKTFVPIKLCLLQRIFVVTKLLLRQKYVGRNKCFVMTTTLLSQQKTGFVVTNVYTCMCCGKSFVGTKMILVAAPANDTSLGHRCMHGEL